MRRLLVVLGAEVLAVWFTSTVVGAHLAVLSPAVVRTAGVADVVLAVTHVAAWAAAWWVLVGTLHDVVVIACGRRRASRRLAPAWVQRIVTRAVGTTVALALASAPAAAAAGQPAPVTADAGAPPADDLPFVRPPVPVLPGPVVAPSHPTPTPTPTPPPTSAGSAVPPEPVDPGVGAPPGPAVPPHLEAPACDAADETPGSAPTAAHVVAAGENLWLIARAALVGHTAEAPSDRDVHRYWLRLIAANDVVSGDPDLILPGEVLHLPPIVEEG